MTLPLLYKVLCKSTALHSEKRRAVLLIVFCQSLWYTVANAGNSRKKGAVCNAGGHASTPDHLKFCARGTQLRETDFFDF